MVTVTIIDREGREIQAAALTGLSVMEAIRQAGFDELEPCAAAVAPALPAMSMRKAGAGTAGRG
jgi:hypothetical protein